MLYDSTSANNRGGHSARKIVRRIMEKSWKQNEKVKTLGGSGKALGEHQPWNGWNQSELVTRRKLLDATMLNIVSEREKFKEAMLRDKKLYKRQKHRVPW